MRKSTLPFQKTDSVFTPSELRKYAEGWILSGEIAQHSAATIRNRRLYVRNLLWFLKRQEYESCSAMELRQFFAYLTNGHKEPCGRWGNPQETNAVKPSTVATYHRHINALFNGIVAEGGMEASSMARIPVPADRPDEVQPFTDEQVNGLLAAARRSQRGGRLLDPLKLIHGS